MADFTEFINIVRSIGGDKMLLEDFLVAITTDKERRELSQRIEIVKRLVKGIPQFKIADELGVGVATVTRGSKELARGGFKALRDQKQTPLK